jgi:hypothetical protein
MYSCTLSLTSVLDGVGGQRHAPAVSPPGKTWYPLYRRLGGPQGQSGRMRKNSSAPRFDPRTVQPVPSRYTDWAIPAQFKDILPHQFQNPESRAPETVPASEGSHDTEVAQELDPSISENIKINLVNTAENINRFVSFQRLVLVLTFKNRASYI